MVVVNTRLLPPGAIAFTFFPFVFVHPDAAPRESILTHEAVHYEQQRRWLIYGLGVGLLLWYLLYLLVLPVGWNPFRAKWEREAYLAQGRREAYIAKTLRGAPYWLWWH
jgi:uncharacterized membrane protein